MDATPGSETGTAGARWRGALTTARIVGLTAAVSLVVGGLVLGPIIAGHQTAAVDSTGQPAEHTVTVTGSGLVSVSPDVADVTIGVSIQKPTVKEARSAAASTMATVVASIKKNGVAAKDIVTTNVSLSPVYDYSSSGKAPKLVGYEFGNSVKATVRNLDSLAAVIDDAAAAGATTIQGISFRLDDPKPVEAQARQLAMSDAKAKADALVAAAGVSIKGVVSISETTTTPSQAYYAMGQALDAKAAAVPTPIQTGTTDVQIVVTVAYLIG